MTDTEDDCAARKMDTRVYYNAAISALPPESRGDLVMPTDFNRAAVYDGRKAYEEHCRHPCALCTDRGCWVGAMLTK